MTANKSIVALASTLNTPAILREYLRLLLALIPFFIASFVGVLWLQFLITATAFIWFFYISKSLQDNFLTLPYIQSQLLPLVSSSSLLIWAVLVVRFAGLNESLGVSIMCGTGAVVVALWPLILRGKATVPVARKYPYIYTYSGFCSLIFFFSLVTNYDLF
jgi:hypothetical protein